MFKLQTMTKYSTIPTYAILDDKLSLSAKGLYTLLFVKTDIVFLDDILKITTTSLDEIKNSLQELISLGYVEKATQGNYKVFIKANKNSATITDVDTSMPFVDDTPTSFAEFRAPKAKDNKFTKMVKIISEYTSDKELKDALINYFTARLSPDPDSRFATSTLEIYKIKPILSSLDTIQDKVESVNYSLEKQYFKFFEKPKKKTLDGVQSNTYTQADIDEIKRRAAELDAQGGQGTF